MNPISSLERMPLSSRFELLAGVLDGGAVPHSGGPIYILHLSIVGPPLNLALNPKPLSPKRPYQVWHAGFL